MTATTRSNALVRSTVPLFCDDGTNNWRDKHLLSRIRDAHGLFRWETEQIMNLKKSDK
jgi:hypothetical protein